MSVPLAPGGPPLERDIDFTAADFAAISALLRDETGIVLSPDNGPLVFARLAKRVRQLQLGRFADYLDLIRAAGGRDEREAMISALTTNTTRFFREPYHFDTLVNEVLPRLAEAAHAGERVRLWSAGCSSGEEAYSLAICLRQCCPDAAQHDIRILATDIDRAVLARAARGRYPAETVDAIAPARRELGFRPAGNGEVEVMPEIRDLVTFRYLNLVQPWPVRGPFQAILCRNVTIYMDDTTQLRIWRGFDRVIAPDGLIFIGHSERLAPELRDRFDLCGKTTYRPAGAAAPVRGAQSQGAATWH